jgi:hypothetical protein
MSEDNRLAARSALKAAQAGLAEGLNRLMVATTAHAGIGGQLEEGESTFGTVGRDALGLGAFAFQSPGDQFLPGGFGARESGMGIGDGASAGGSGGRSILPTESSVGGSFVLPILLD